MKISYGLAISLFLSGLTSSVTVWAGPQKKAESNSCAVLNEEYLGLKEIDGKIYIYKKPPWEKNYAKFYAIFPLIVNACFLPSAISMQDKRDRLLLYNIGGIHTAGCFAVAAYFGYYAYKKRNQTEEAILTLSSEGFQCGDSKIYLWKNLSQIKLNRLSCGSYSNTWITFEFFSQKNIEVPIDEMAISEEELMNLFKRYKRFFSWTTTRYWNDKDKKWGNLPFA